MGFGGSGAVLEAPALVAGLDDVAMVGQAVEQRGRHLGIAEHVQMPQRPTRESLRSGSLSRIIPCTAIAFRPVIDAPAGDRRSGAVAKSVLYVAHGQRLSS